MGSKKYQLVEEKTTICKGITLHLMRKRIKNRYIRIKPGGEVEVSVPYYISDQQLAAFLEKNWHWIQIKREEILKREKTPMEEPVYRTGEWHDLWGISYELLVERSLKRPLTEIRGKKIYMRVPAKSTTVERRKQLDAFYKEELMEKLQDIKTIYEPIVGKRAEEWRFRRMKTRWGSCQIQRKRICLNIQLAEKPVECLAYVVVHELTHLHEPSHNRRFWSLVEQFYDGDVMRAKELLK